MRWTIAIAILLSAIGCWDPPRYEGRACDEQSGCPAGLVCFAGTCRASLPSSDDAGPTIDGGSNDLDASMPDSGDGGLVEPLDAGPDAGPDAGSPPECGDGELAVGEACDDDNVIDGDGCSATCSVESGWACEMSPSRCGPICGDGRRIANEQCDDGDTMNGNGCSSSCTVELGFVCPRQPSECVVADADLVAYLDFDDEPGTIAMDVTGHGHVGTVFGRPVWETGQRGTSIRLDGIDDYVLVDDFDYGQDFTVIVWARIPTTTVSSQYHVLVQHGYTSEDDGVIIRVDNAGVNAMYTRFDDVRSGASARPGRYDFAEWHQFAVVYNNGETEGYVDGMYQGGESGPPDAIDPISDFALGIDHRVIPETSLIGSIDEVRVYRRALGQVELLGLYASDRGARRASVGAVHDAMTRGGIYADLTHDVGSMHVKIGNNPDFDRETMFQFDLAGITTVTSAQLVFTYGDVNAPNIQHGIAVLGDNWQQDTITWNNRPAAGPDVVTWTPPGTDLVHSIDVTASVQAEAAGDGRASFVIRSLVDVGGDGIASYLSRETSAGAYLLLQY